jgi:hypothetical protein
MCIGILEYEFSENICELKNLNEFFEKIYELKNLNVSFLEKNCTENLKIIFQFVFQNFSFILSYEEEHFKNTRKYENEDIILYIKSKMRSSHKMVSGEYNNGGGREGGCTRSLFGPSLKLILRIWII